jgi:hypothetical protein
MQEQSNRSVDALQSAVHEQDKVIDELIAHGATSCADTGSSCEHAQEHRQHVAPPSTSASAQGSVQTHASVTDGRATVSSRGVGGGATGIANQASGTNGIAIHAAAAALLRKFAAKHEPRGALATLNEAVVKTHAHLAEDLCQVAHKMGSWRCTLTMTGAGPSPVQGVGHADGKKIARKRAAAHVILNICQAKSWPVTWEHVAHAV